MMEEVWSKLSHHADAHPELLFVAPLLVILSLVFFCRFVPRAWALRRRLTALTKQIEALKSAAEIDPGRVSIKDLKLRHLWKQYVQTLHRPDVDTRTGVARGKGYRSTLPAEAIFNASAVFEGRLYTEYYKNLPGLLTGLGIIATFFGLIRGLGSASQGKDLNTQILIGAVGEAFYVSAAAIGLAMVITLIEKLWLANLHKAVEELCRRIDDLYASGAGEEYLSRLVVASEESAAQASILKDALVGDLTAILERISQQQIAAAAAQQTAMQQDLVAAINTGLAAPLGELAEGLVRVQSQQGSTLSQGLQDSMAAFADKLDQLLGGQVVQARDLQQQTLAALEKSVTAFQSMAREVGHAGTAATSAMSSQLEKTLTDMAAGQEQMNATMRAFVEELRLSAINAQVETRKELGTLLSELGQQMNTALAAVQAQSSAAAKAQNEHLGSVSAMTAATAAELAENARKQYSALDDASSQLKSTLASAQAEMNAMMQGFAGQMRESIEQTQQGTAKGVEATLGQLGQQLSRSLAMLEQQSSAATSAHREQLEGLSTVTGSVLSKLADNVQAQTSATEAATAAMRGAVSEMGSSVQRNVSLMGQGADQMRLAADRFSTSGGAIADVFDRSKSVASELTQVAARLSSSSQDVETVVSDYRAAREAFAGIVSSLNETVDTAKRDAGMTSDLVRQLELAAQKLQAAQGHADQYLLKVNEVIAGAHSHFSEGMKQTVRSANGEFQESLSKATGLLANTISEFEQALGDNMDRRRAGSGR